MAEFCWSCTCGRGGASWWSSWEDARRDGELHQCRAGALRALHEVFVKPRRAQGV